MTNPNDPVDIVKNSLTPAGWSGLTKREYFAAMAMQGLCSAWLDYSSNTITPNLELIPDAIGLADTLIEALNQEPKP